VSAGQTGPEQRTQVQNGGSDTIFLVTLWTLAGPSEESVLHVCIYVNSKAASKYLSHC
jgi:hypothetical protein